MQPINRGTMVQEFYQKTQPTRIVVEDAMKAALQGKTVAAANKNS